ncbi:unannotated protein [freshwater metagenome]|uniref:Unannotated protein n=1 Tax=freshwater metagenome TaxID=449393 RepID=A0A6J6HL94_9ZZZZ
MRNVSVVPSPADISVYTGAYGQSGSEAKRSSGVRANFMGTYLVGTNAIGS